MGVSWNDFWKMNPRIIKAISNGYNEKLKRQDYMLWLNNQYTLSAVYTALDHLLNGKKAKSEYFKKPIMEEVCEREQLNENDLQKQRELFVAKLETMKANFEIAHPEKKQK